MKKQVKFFRFVMYTKKKDVSEIKKKNQMQKEVTGRQKSEEDARFLMYLI